MDIVIFLTHINIRPNDFLKSIFLCTTIAGQKCPAEERKWNTCRDRGHFDMSRLCKKKKEKAARRVKEELKETTSEEMDTKEEKEINRVVRDHVWPGTSGKAKRRSVRHVMEERGDQGHDIVVVNSEGEARGVMIEAMTLSWSTLRAWASGAMNEAMTLCD